MSASVQSLPRIIEQRDGDDDTTDEFIWGPGYVDELVTHDRDTDDDGTTDERFYAVHDRQYNVLMLADEDGAAVEQYAYSPYGADPLDPRDGFAHTIEGDSQLPLTADMSAAQFLYTGRNKETSLNIDVLPMVLVECWGGWDCSSRCEGSGNRER